MPPPESGAMLSQVFTRSFSRCSRSRLRRLREAGRGNVLPAPRARLSTSTAAPWSCARCLTIARPSPLPGRALRARPVDLVEALEDLVPLGPRDPRTLVRDREARPPRLRGRAAASTAAPSGENLIALSSRLRGDLPEPAAVADDRQTASSPRHREPDAASRARPRPRSCATSRRSASSGTSSRSSGDRPALDLGEVHQIVDQLAHPVGLAADQLEEVGLAPLRPRRRPPSVSAAAAIDAIGVRSSCETSATKVRRMASVRSSRVTSRSTPTAAAREPSGSGTTDHLPDDVVRPAGRSGPPARPSGGSSRRARRARGAGAGRRAPVPAGAETPIMPRETLVGLEHVEPVVHDRRGRRAGARRPSPSAGAPPPPGPGRRSSESFMLWSAAARAGGPPPPRPPAGRARSRPRRSPTPPASARPIGAREPARGGRADEEEQRGRRPTIAARLGPEIASAPISLQVRRRTPPARRTLPSGSRRAR